jgi:hypothetical protein
MGHKIKRCQICGGILIKEWSDEFPKCIACGREHDNNGNLIQPRKAVAVTGERHFYRRH